MSCFYCGEPLAWRITAGSRTGRPGEYREIGVCRTCVPRGTRWAAVAGPPTIAPLSESASPNSATEPAQQPLFQL